MRIFFSKVHLLAEKPENSRFELLTKKVNIESLALQTNHSA